MEVAAPAEAPAASSPAPAETTAPAAAPAAGGSDFDLSGIPEQVRPTVEPVFKQFTEKHQKELTQYKESMKPHQDKAEALDKLLQEPWFQKAWYDSRSPQQPAAQTPPEARPPIVSPEEWQTAYDKALSGDMGAMNSLTEKQLDSLVQQKYAPVMQQIAQKQREIDLNMEMTDLFQKHPDAKELDKAGLLEPAMHLYVDKQKRSMEYAYQQAAKMKDYFTNKAKQELTAQAQEKKTAATETPASTTGDASIVFVDSPREALRQQLMAAAKGLKVQYRVRPKK